MIEFSVAYNYVHISGDLKGKRAGINIKGS
jgi:hypothetical protein